MVVELFLIAALFIFFTGWGLWVKYLLAIPADTVAVTSLLGLVFFSIACCVAAFFTPLTLGVEIVFLVAGILPYFSKKLRAGIIPFPQAMLRSAWFWAFALTIVLVGCYYAFVPDQFNYYIPTLQWLNRFGFIIGTAVIDWSVGQMSMWHIIQAGLDQTIDPFLRINIFVAVLYLVYLFERKSYWMLFFIAWYFLFIQTVSPDVPIAFLALIVVNESCFHYQKANFPALLILAVFAFTIKLVTFWLPAWVLFVYLYKNKAVWIEKSSGKTCLFVGLLVCVFVLKNVIISSCLVYPVGFSQIDTYWCAHPGVLADYQNVMTRLTFNLRYSLEEVQSFSLLYKFRHWLTYNDPQAVMNLGIILLSLLFGIFAFIKKNVIYMALWSLIVVKIGVVFLSSGQFRFLLDGVFPLLLIFFTCLPLKINQIHSLALSVILVAALALSYPSFILKFFSTMNAPWMMEGFTSHALLVPETDRREAYEEEKIGNLTIHITTGYYFNFDTPPPAFTSYTLKQLNRLNVFPQMRDSVDIRKGFYMKKLSTEDKAKLEQIIDRF
ncbi:hypothetical protein FACS1894176_02830 [Bacteroidia bacterium]|nr:hypothetical protein FACS1894176_02830 [Bacteroidia bacterium]